MSDRPNTKIVHALVREYEPVHGHIPIVLIDFIYKALDQAREDERDNLQLESNLALGPND